MYKTRVTNQVRSLALRLELSLINKKMKINKYKTHNTQDALTINTNLNFARKNLKKKKAVKGLEQSSRSKHVTLCPL